MEVIRSAGHESEVLAPQVAPQEPMMMNWMSAKDGINMNQER